ncbi:MAG: hypothetical protein EPN76_14980 [Burkholderiaceae bacterium]|nr:MAG: hypothetical protein EPN76_14980 [Burkholderiaceae bacterium]
MAKSSWSYLKGERRVGEYEEMTVQSIGHWSIMHDTSWPQALRDGYHLFSGTGIGMTEPTSLHIKNGAAYRDRYKLTYRSYILQQDNEEKKLDAIFDTAKQRDCFSDLQTPVSIRRLYIPAIRHFFWGAGLMQIYGSAYTPYGPVMNTLLFQVFDAMRHAQRLVELSWEINRDAPGEIDSREIWMHWGPLQALRKYIEYGLTVFDWGESFVALNFVLDPLFLPLHERLMIEIPEASGDWAIAHYWLCLSEDSKRHITTGEDFIQAVLKEDERNHAVVQGWLDRWYGLAIDAIDGLRPLFEDGGILDFDEVKDETLKRYSETLSRYGLNTPAVNGESYEPAISISR